jgi:proteasome lid subunit RPN8/RPN11
MSQKNKNTSSPRLVVVVTEPFWPFVVPSSPVPEAVYALFGSVLRFPRRNEHTYICIREIHQAPNTHPEPIANFRVLSKDIPKASSPANRLIGWIHDHPPGQGMPSPNDIKGITPGLYGAVWCNGTVVWYDCRGLLRSYYLS